MDQCCDVHTRGPAHRAPEYLIINQQVDLQAVPHAALMAQGFGDILGLQDPYHSHHQVRFDGRSWTC